MKPEFREQIDALKAKSKGPLPIVPFSTEIRSALAGSADVMDHFEGRGNLRRLYGSRLSGLGRTGQRNLGPTGLDFEGEKMIFLIQGTAGEVIGKS